MAMPLTNPPLGAVVWVIQISAAIVSTANISALQHETGADCVSSVGNGGSVLPCNPTPTPGNYLVWERLPSLASPAMSSRNWLTMPGLKGFKLQYTHDQMFEISNQTYIDDGVSGVSQGYYTCGG